MKMGKIFVLPDELVEYFKDCAGCDDIEAVMVLRRHGNRSQTTVNDTREGCIDLYHAHEDQKPLFAYVEQGGKTTRVKCDKGSPTDTSLSLTTLVNGKAKTVAATRLELTVKEGSRKPSKAPVPHTAVDFGEVVYMPLDQCYWSSIAGFAVTCG